MAFTVNKKAFCVLEFAKTESIVTVQRSFRIMYHTELPTDKTILEWYMNSSRVAACVLRNEQAVRAHGRKNCIFALDRRIFEARSQVEKTMAQSRKVKESKFLTSIQHAACSHQHYNNAGKT